MRNLQLLVVWAFFSRKRKRVWTTCKRLGLKFNFNHWSLRVSVSKNIPGARAHLSQRKCQKYQIILFCFSSVKMRCEKSDWCLWRHKISRIHLKKKKKLCGLFKAKKGWSQPIKKTIFSSRKVTINKNHLFQFYPSK